MSERHTAPAKDHAGILISTPLDGGPTVIRDTVRCGHCQRIGIWVPGCGNKLRRCPTCAEIICGSPLCQTCVHWEQRLENCEAGRPEDFKRIIGSVEAEVPKG